MREYLPSLYKRSASNAHTYSKAMPGYTGSSVSATMVITVIIITVTLQNRPDTILNRGNCFCENPEAKENEVHSRNFKQFSTAEGSSTA